MHASWVLSLPESVSISPAGRDGLKFESSVGHVELTKLGSACCAALRGLAFPGQPFMQLVDTVESQGSADDRIRLIYHLRILLRRRLLQFHVLAADCPLATLESTSAALDVEPAKPPSGRFMLSRFAYVHCEAELMILETPLTAARIVLHDPRATALLHALARPVSMDSLRTATSELDCDSLEALICLLNSAQMLTAVDEHDRRTEDEQPGLKFWEFHDALFHVHSRLGRHDRFVGGAYHWAGIDPAPPAMKRADGKDAIELFRPDLAHLEQSGASFAQVAEQRCSVREYADRPLTAEQLGEFLFRAARVKELFEIDVETYAEPVCMEFSTRPYPSAGGLYELEVYALIRACSGLDAGLYHYDPLDHRLCPVAASEPSQSQLLAQAAWSAGVDEEKLQVLLILSARFPRVMWKYASMAYAAILKNVGVVYQAMYLAASAMQLAPCALGAGDSDEFSRAIGSNHYEETSVGEFLLGSLPPGGPKPWSAKREDRNA